VIEKSPGEALRRGPSGAGLGCRVEHTFDDEGLKRVGQRRPLRLRGRDPVSISSSLVQSDVPPAYPPARLIPVDQLAIVDETTAPELANSTADPTVGVTRWSRTVRHGRSFQGRCVDAVGPRHLAPLALSSREEGSDGQHLELPSPRSVLRHALPIVLEGFLVPLGLFYVVLVTAGFRGALIAALAWSYVAFVRRLKRGERVSTMLLLGVVLLTARTAVSFATGSAFVYFAQPTATMVAASLVLVASAVIGRPFTQRFALDFCPMGAELLARPRVRRFFIRISLLWATVLMLNAGIVLWLLVSSSLRAFVLERTAVTWSLTALAIFFSITRFMSTMRRDGITVEWGRYRKRRLVPVT